MSNSMHDDYFSFMSERRERPPAKGSAAPVKARPSPARDTIDFVHETAGIEVTEGVASDTLIQRVRNRWGVGR